MNLPNVTIQNDLPFVPYGRQTIDDEDIRLVMDTLKSDWLTTGPQVELFEKAVADFTGTQHAVAVSSGTAALHAAMFAIDIQPGDEVILSPMTFAATANAVVYQGGTPVFADIDPDTLLIDPAAVRSKITERTKAVIAVDYAGQPCEYDELQEITEAHQLHLVADACHSLGAAYKGTPVGALAALTVFSFHPVKPITTGEGGMIVTDSKAHAGKMRAFRNHGITTDHHQRSSQETWAYEMTTLGYNYRVTDFQCALGTSQIKKLPGWIKKRQKIADAYTAAFSDTPGIAPLKAEAHVSHVYHLYVIKIDPSTCRIDRGTFFSALRSRGIGANVHYIPVYLHPFYRRRFGFQPGACPRAEAAYEQILSLPVFPQLADSDLERVIQAVRDIAKMAAA